MKSIKTKNGEIFDNIKGESYMDISNTNNQFMIPCYVVEINSNIGWGRCIRKIPMNDVVEVVDDYNQTFTLKENKE